MKKIAFIMMYVFISSLFVPYVCGADFYTKYNITLKQNEIENIYPLTIIATENNEILLEYGINLIIDSERDILWNASEIITVFGTAADNGKIPHSIAPVYSSDYKKVYIPINSDWEIGESATFSGLSLRSYKREFNFRYIGLDINGDDIADFSDVNGYRVSSDIATDRVAPYPVSDLEYKIINNGESILLNWKNPPDYDFARVIIERYLSRNTFISNIIIFEGALETYIDNDIRSDDQIIYKFYTRDRTNKSQPVELAINMSLTENIQEETEEDVPEEATESEEDDIEIADLNRLYNYYKIRYSIKCMRGGIPAKENDSACLWARIDLIYAQEQLDKDDVDTSLSAKDLELMAKRRKYPKERYLLNCTNAEIPADYCPALGKAIERTVYFID